MVSKKGFIRIVELLIAVTMISIVLLLTYKQSIPKQNTLDLTETARDVLSEVSSKEDLRKEIVQQQTNVNAMTKTLIYINQSIPDYINYELKSCLISSSCGQSNYVGDVYSAERIISSSNNLYGPIKLRLFLWID